MTATDPRTLFLIVSATTGEVVRAIQARGDEQRRVAFDQLCKKVDRRRYLILQEAATHSPNERAGR